MSLGELSAPVRVCWDLSGEDNGVDPVRIAGDLIEAGVLAVELSAPRLTDAARVATDLLIAAGRRVSLTVPPEAAAHGPAGLAELLVHHRSAEAIERFVDAGGMESLHGAARAVGVSVEPTAANLRRLPRLVDALAMHGVTRLVLPIPRPAGEPLEAPLAPAERAALAQALAARVAVAGPRTTVAIIVHDPFFWADMRPTAGCDATGCQAGNTLMYISPEALVTPCPLLPIVLGDLRASTFGDIVRTADKQTTRQNTRTIPTECDACERDDSCRGGCRGRAYLLEGGLERRDPACDS